MHKKKKNSSKKQKRPMRISKKRLINTTKTSKKLRNR
nr:MAG TPA: hypothetical protein [Bacteriophage sp.]